MSAYLDSLREQRLINLAVYSVFKMSETLTDEEVICQLRLRFKNSLPLQNIDCVLVHSLEEPVADPDEARCDSAA